jgi:hypothetical protein
MYDDVNDARMAALYPGRSRADVARIWRDVVQPLAHQPFTEFRERPLLLEEDVPSAAIFIDGLNETAREPLYVDVVHYAPRFAARLAALIDERAGALVRAEDRRDRE